MEGVGGGGVRLNGEEEDASWIDLFAAHNLPN